MRPVKRSFAVLAIMALCLVAFSQGQLQATGPRGVQSQVPSRLEIQAPIVSEPVIPHVTNVDLRTLPTVDPWQPGDPVREIARRTYTRTAPGSRLSQPGGLLQDPLLAPSLDAPSAAGRAFSTPILNYEGIPFTGVRPPDTVGDVGPNHYIQMVNGGAGTPVVIYDKAGTLLSGPFYLDSMWTAGGQCASGYGDPIVLYDRSADRWLMSEFAGSGNHLCVYVSQSADPVSGGWYLYDFQTTNFPDYPKYAVWPDAYYVSTNENDPAAYALDREQMLLGATATSQRFTAPDLAGFPFQALIPSDLDGATLPPAGAPNYFMRHRDDEVHNPGSNDPSQDFLEIWEFHVDFVTPANSSFTKALDVALGEFDSDLCGLSSFYCFPQPGTSTTLDPLREVVMWRLQYRNFGSHETLVGNLVTDVDGTDHGGIRWFELRRVGGGSWTVFQEGTVAPDAHHRWMGSIAMDGSGNIALGYSISSSTVYPGIRYTGRLAGDPAGTMPQGEYTIIDGAGYQSPVTRWGDYSAMSVDPADDCTFWYTNEYLPANGLWQTRIATFKFPECGNPDFTLGAEPDALEVCAPEIVTSTVQVGQVSGYDHNVTLEVLDVPAGVAADIVPAVVTPPGEAVLTLDVSDATADGTYMLTISGTGEIDNVHTVGVELSVSSSPQVSLTSDAPVELGWAVRFTAEVTAGTPPLAYLWGFGGAGAASGEGTATPVFTYTDPGSYTATVTVTNGCGAGVESVGVEILCYEPEATLVSNGPVMIGEPVLVTATLSGTAPLSYTWAFGGDGTGAGFETLTPVYTYTNPGDFVVGLEVTGPCGAGTVTETVTVEALRYYIYLPLVHK